ncbi:MAG: hypothetical protein JWN48_4606 [Myxococcaceae bacterium]|nr:hypothetical protein [Myxococcaceae bacterium]
MTADEVALLTQLLRKLSAEGLGTPRTPKEVFGAFKGVVTQPAVELLVTRSGSDVLLTRREDRHWHGWHLPGGFVGVEETLEAAATRIAKVELGTGAKLQRIVGHYTWPNHPYASALSLLCLCELEGAPADGQFFEPLPDDLLAGHRALLQRFWPER